MNEEIRLTRDIYNFVRGRLSWEESLKLLDKVVMSDEWISHFEMDMMLYQMTTEEWRPRNTISTTLH